MKTNRSLVFALSLALACGTLALGMGAASAAEPFSGQTLLAQTSSKETPAFCEEQYRKCLADCEANPSNQQDHNAMTQCRAYCESVHSGCGK